MTKEGQANLNKYLLEKYGTLFEKPRFRVIWSTDETEVRESDFKQEVMGLDLPLVHDTRKVPKYSFAMDRWVLEEIVFSKYIPKEIKTMSEVSYIPLYIFWIGDAGEYQEPELFDVDQMCYYRVNNTLKGHKPTEADLKKKELEQKKRNKNLLREKLDDAIPDIPHALKHGEGVSLYVKEKDEVLPETQQSDKP